MNIEPTLIEKYTRAYLIGGPFHGDIRSLTGTGPELHTLRVADPPQMPQWKQDDPWEPRMKTGIYQRTSPLRYDPINHQPEHDPVCYIYEWMGWEGR